MTNQHLSIPSQLRAHWLVVGFLFLLLIAYNFVCHVWGVELRINLDEAQREIIRTVLYGAAIILFPLTNLLRFILLRLNQTMPGDKSAKQRYFFTTTVALLLIETVAFFGFVMFILGDDFNTLYIFSVLGGLGLFLHRPKIEELAAIDYALSAKNQ
ncbi:MAG: hypothetical protein RLZ92_54 [Pseudomonadota bacterium]|mgnify:CR=1 FL=1|jgi:hypothetical protein